MRFHASAESLSVEADANCIVTFCDVCERPVKGSRFSGSCEEGLRSKVATGFEFMFSGPRLPLCICWYEGFSDFSSRSG